MSQLWVVGAGKGGIGKTFVSSSLGITLSKLNFKVLIVDFDMSGANLHTTFGLKLSDKNLRMFFDDGRPMEELIQTTEIPKVSYLQGFWDSWAPSDVSVDDTQKLMTACRKLNYDYVLFDLGAGPLLSYLELFVHADEKILISDSEPTSVEKTYRFLESFICYSLRESTTRESYQKLQTTLRAYRNSDHKGYFSFRSYLKEAVGFSFDYFEQLNQRPVRLLVNSCRCRQDQDLGHSIKSVCHKYYDLRLDYVGAIDFDNAVWQSVKSREPMLIEKPFTPLAGQFLSVCKQLTNTNSTANLYRAAV